MSQDKKSRGRPLGSSRHAQSDEQAMLEVARIMAANPKLSMTQAIRLVINTEQDTGGVRRLQGKLQGRIDELVKGAAAQLAEIRKEQEIQQFREMLDSLIPQFLTQLAELLRSHGGNVRTLFRLARKPDTPKEILYEQLGITPEKMTQVAQHMVALSLILKDFSATEGAPYLASLLHRLSSMSWMVEASGNLSAVKESDNEQKADAAT